LSNSLRNLKFQINGRKKSALSPSCMKFCTPKIC
jgi:hypothetical protein